MTFLEGRGDSKTQPLSLEKGHCCQPFSCAWDRVPTSLSPCFHIKNVQNLNFFWINDLRFSRQPSSTVGDGWPFPPLSGHRRRFEVNHGRHRRWLALSWQRKVAVLSKHVQRVQ